MNLFDIIFRYEPSYENAKVLSDSLAMKLLSGDYNNFSSNKKILYSLVFNVLKFVITSFLIMSNVTFLVIIPVTFSLFMMWLAVYVFVTLISIVSNITTLAVFVVLLCVVYMMIFSLSIAMIYSYLEWFQKYMMRD